MNYSLLVRPSKPTFYTTAMNNDDFAKLKDSLEEIYLDNSVLTLRGKKCQNKEGFFNEWGAVLQVPHYFGENWAALNDILYENDWLPGTIFLITDAHLFLKDAAERDFQVFIEIMDKCNSDNSVEEDKIKEEYTFGFHLIFQSDEEHLDRFLEKLKLTGTSFAKAEFTT